MDTSLLNLREKTVSDILSKQDGSFRWGYSENQARERPEYLYYSPNFKSTLWTLVFLAELKAPLDLPQINAAIQLIADHFYDPESGIYRLPNMSHFPIPCLNGNMLYLQYYFEMVIRIFRRKSFLFSINFSVLMMEIIRHRSPTLTAQTHPAMERTAAIGVS